MAAFTYTAQRGLSLLGDEKGAWMASTVAETLLSSDLVTGGDMSDVADWTAVNCTLSIVAGALRLTNTLGGVAYAYQQITTVVGEQATYTIDLTAEALTSGVIISAGTAPNNQDYGSLYNAVPTIGGMTLSFTPTATVSYFSMVMTSSSVAGETCDWDNASILVGGVDDLTPNDNNLLVYGSIVKSAVAPGAELVGYSNFGASNYLKQPYNADLNFGTADCAFVGWVKKGSSTGYQQVLQLDAPGSNVGVGSLGIAFNTSGSLYGRMYDGTVLDVENPSVADDDTFYFVAAVVRSGVLYFYVDGVMVASRVAVTIGGSNFVLMFGLRTNLTSAPATTAEVTLWRVFAYAPTAAQIKSIYADEKHLFKKYSTYSEKGQSYSVDIRLKSADESAQTFRSENTSLDRTQTEVIVSGDDNEIDITTTILHRTDSTMQRISQFDELMFATRGGEPFSMDVRGTVANEDEPKSIVRVGNRIIKSRMGKDMVRAGFKVREL